MTLLCNLFDRGDEIDAIDFNVTGLAVKTASVLEHLHNPEKVKKWRSKLYPRDANEVQIKDLDKTELKIFHKAGFWAKSKTSWI
jgi:hypothetical protein